MGQTDEALRRAFRNMLAASLSSQTAVADAEMDKIRTELADLSRRFVALERRLLASTRRAEDMRGLRGRLDEADAELARLISLPGVRSLSVVDCSLHVTVGPIQIEWNGALYHLGDYRIVLDLAGDVRVESLSRLGPRPYWDHPHIQGGLPCLGNIRDGVLKLIADYELALAVQVLMDFLRTYRPESAYCLLEGWPRSP